MVIGINGYEAVVPRFGFDSDTNLPRRVGSSEFCFQLLKGFAALKSNHTFLTFLPTRKRFDLPDESEHWVYKTIKQKKLWTIFGLGRYFLTNRKDIDVFFSPTHYLPFFVPIPSVISILDVSYIYYPELFNKRDLYQLKLWGSYSVKKAKAIITISESSKNDIIKEYKVPESKVHVVHLGIKEFNQNFMSMEELSQKYSVTKPYILFVGTLQPRKNIVKLIEAFSFLKNKEIDLVIIGKKGWKYEDILNAPEKFGVERRIKFLDTVPDNDLPSFYKYAEVFVLPSLYEGFGLPVLESMSFGCPVLTSNVSSLPEAGGDAALYFDPNNVNDIASKIEEVITDSTLREDMKKKGFEQVKKFSWDRAALETLEILEAVGTQRVKGKA